MKYKAYSLSNYLTLPQIEKISAEKKSSIEVVGSVLPFKVSNYVTDELIDWDDYENDPIFHLTFPQKEMLLPHHFNKMAEALVQSSDKQFHKNISNEIRLELNPHPAGQREQNIPKVEGLELLGTQHKYRETVLFFPSSGQTCHSYCTFCFRWPQFVGMDELKFAMKETELLIKYLEIHHEATDILFTGGDPMIMSFKVFEKYIEPFLYDYKKTNIQTIRIGTKSLAFWPYKFLTDDDADDFLRLFEKIISKGINLAIMAHFSHPRELATAAVQKAIKRIRNTGAQIRTQSPILRHINDKAEIWSEMWRKQVNFNCIPYYMFVPRDTGAQHYFAVTLLEAWEIWRKAYQNVSGVCRTVRGPSMSCSPGKVQFLGVGEVNHEKVFVLRFLQGRNPDWVARPFFAKYDENAIWMSDLKPAFGEKFFFEDEEETLFGEKYIDRETSNYE
ncbi:MAG: lysine 2,3-aminomutase [Ignavibacteria bacterium CG_4_10_14_3_um_filter_37_18]|nr:MAG: lysine 2,3-aminomutase [Ignavibacteria bacterium CG_4_10_14_3_um_filter_37_18]